MKAHALNHLYDSISQDKFNVIIDVGAKYKADFRLLNDVLRTRVVDYFPNVKF